MPWKAFKVGSGFCVFRVDANGKRFGSSLGCHSSQPKANAQLAALNINVGERKEDMNDFETNVKATKIGTFIRNQRKKLGMSIVDLEKKMPIDETTISNIETGDIETPSTPVMRAFAKALNVSFSNLRGMLPSSAKPLENIAPGGGGRKDASTASDTALPDPTGSSDKNLHPGSDHEVSTHTAPLTFEEMDAVSEAREKAAEMRTNASNMNALANNILRFAPVEEQPGLFTKLADGMKKRFSTVKSAAQKLITKSEKTSQAPDDTKSNSTFLVFKDKDTGEYKFITTYSNNIRDTDNPPEIISAASHRRFVDLVDKGEAPLPELWLWHSKELVIGQVDVIAYEDDTGAAWAAGSFYKEAGPIAEVIMADLDAWGVSHGMPSSSISRDKNDRTIITEHITQEISPLPRFNAANKWADFTVLNKESNMLTPDKKEELVTAGFGESMLAAIQARTKKVSETVDELALERKEQAKAEENEPKVEVKVDVGTEKSEKHDIEPAFNEKQTGEIQDAFVKFGETLFTGIIAEVKTILAPIVEAQVEFAEKEQSLDERARSLAEQTPAKALSDLLFPPATLRDQSATQVEKLDKRKSVNKALIKGPAKPEKELVYSQDATTNDFVDGLINFNEKWNVHKE